MRTSEVERRILYAVTLNASASVSTIAEMLGVRSHTVRRTISMLLANRVFLRRSVWVNTHVLGLSYYIIQLELPLRSFEAREEFLATVCGFEETAAVVELGGEAQFELRILARDSFHLAWFFEQLASKFRHTFRISKFLTTLEQEYSGPHDPARPPETGASLRLGPLHNRIQKERLDKTDHLILSALANHNYLHLQEIARLLKIAPTTVQYRITKLESSGIISGHFYVMDPKVLNVFPVCLEVRSRTLLEREKKALKVFASQHPRISWIGFFLGEQSAEIYALVQDFDQAQAIIVELSSEFKNVIDSVCVTPQLNFFKYSTYPFRKFESLVGPTS
jgi:DNA-binding Lrp family transcriptional regulator